MTTETSAFASILETFSGIDDGYKHVPKWVTPGETLQPARVLLKWYEVHPLDRPVPEEIRNLARRFILASTLEAQGLGFVLLHRCGTDFYFLIICTWRNSNELWQTVFYKDGDAMAEFASWPRDDAHKPTLCVWEFVPAWHEQQAWVRFLESGRDEAAAESWLGDRFEGKA